MIKNTLRRYVFIAAAILFVGLALFLPAQGVLAQVGRTPTVCPTAPGAPPGSTSSPCIQVNQTDLGFQIPTLSGVLTFAIRAFFIIAGLAALLYLLLGALAWVTSGGDKENVSKAQSKITNAIIGVVLIAVVLAVVVTLEQVVFARTICLGLSCPITIPGLVQPL